MTTRDPRTREEREAFARTRRVIRGAIKSALDAHPGWVSKRLRGTLRESITKRVVGAIAADRARASPASGAEPVA